MKKNTLKKKNLTLKVDENIKLKTLFADEISESYVSWLNDYEVTKFTDQKDFKSTLETVEGYVNQLYFSGNDLLFHKLAFQFLPRVNHLKYEGYSFYKIL